MDRLRGRRHRPAGVDEPLEPAKLFSPLREADRRNLDDPIDPREEAGRLEVEGDVFARPTGGLHADALPSLLDPRRRHSLDARQVRHPATTGISASRPHAGYVC
jgi:hypothetical protein